MGMIGTATHDLFIQPLSKEHKETYQRRRRDVSNPHVIYRRSVNEPVHTEDEPFCALDPDGKKVHLTPSLKTTRVIPSSHAPIVYTVSALIQNILKVRSWFI